MIRVLFLCTGNSARSLIAEGILRSRGTGRFEAFSAGSKPTGKPHPGALSVLEANQIDTQFAASKSWDVFAGEDVAKMDVIITVCANAAGETCPLWPGQPVSAHWGVEDPAAVTSSAEATEAAFAQTFDEMSRRINAFLDLPMTDDIADNLAGLRAIGQMDS